VLDVLFALVAISGMVVAGAALSRAYMQLATLLQMFAIFLASQLIVILVGDAPRRQLWLGVAIFLGLRRRAPVGHRAR
jgi:hypothetical protein